MILLLLKISYGGGHYDSITGAMSAASILHTAPGVHEEHIIQMRRDAIGRGVSRDMLSKLCTKWNL